MTRFGAGRPLRYGAATTVMFGVVSALSAAWAQTDVDQLEDLKAERERNVEAAAATAEQIDVDNATVDELAAALDQLNVVVQFHRSRLEDAQREHAAALSAVDSAAAERADVLARMERTRDRIADLALSSFTGESSLASDDMTALALSDNPGEAVRFRHLVELQTGSLSDGLDALRSLEVTAQLLIEAEEAAAADAARSLTDVEERNAELDIALERQQVLVTAAETQLEARLAEAAFLLQRDADLARSIQDQQQSINRRIAGVARKNGVEIPRPVDLDDIVVLRFPDDRPDFVIEVHVDIAEETEALFREAWADGLDLGGFGYRPIQEQIELRAAHCGGTDFDIWQKPVFECAPPTARPGFSKHEQGRAVDFTVGGEPVRSEESWAFRWLADHAPRYGFENLVGEPWHWSID